MTVGSLARQQFGMAKIQASSLQANYSSGLDGLYGAQLAKKYGSSSVKAATQSLEDLLKSNALKNKSSIFREQFSNLYNSIYGVSDGSSDTSGSYSTKQSIKVASASAGGAAESIKSFANSLQYGGDVNVDSYRSYAQSFVDSYNEMIDKVGNSDSMNILQKGVLMTNTGKVYSSALKRAGITVGSDNKLTLNDNLSNIKARDIKTVFGNMGFSDKVIQKAGQINSLSGGNGVFSAGIHADINADKNNSTNTEEDVRSLKEMSVAVKDSATDLKSYVNQLGSEDKEYIPKDFTDLAKSFADHFNSLIDEMGKSDKSVVRENGVVMQSMSRSYKFALERVGISVDSDGKLSITEAIKNATKEDIQYSFGNNSFLDKIMDKADQTKSLVTSASAMGYGADKTATYAYNIGALFSMYA